MAEDKMESPEAKESALTLPTPHEESGFKSWPRWARVTVVLTSVLVVLLLIAWLLLPTIAAWYLRSYVLPDISESIGHEIAFEDLDVHGFSGATLHTITLAAPGEPPLLEIDAIEVQLDGAVWSDFHVEAIHISRPVVTIAKRPDGSLNVAHLAKNLEKRFGKKKKKSGSSSSGSGGEKKHNPLDPLPTITINDGEVRGEGLEKGPVRLQQLSNLSVSLSPDWDREEALELIATLQLSYAMEGGDERVQAIELGGLVDTRKLEESQAEVAFGGGLQLPLDPASETFVGLRLRGLGMTVEPAKPESERAEGEKKRSALERAQLKIEYNIGPLRWSTREPVAQLAWLDRLVYWPFSQDSGALPVTTEAEAATLSDSSIRAYNRGREGEPRVVELRPMMSSGEAYTEKWDLRAEGDDYRLRFTFQVANLGLGDFKGQVSGYVRRLAPDGTIAETFKFSKKLSQKEWSSAEQGFDLRMGDDFRLWEENGTFHAKGIAGKGESAIPFEYAVTGKGWKPGTGVVLLGKEGDKYYKNTVAIMDGKGTGTLQIGGQPHTSTIERHVYLDHFATNVEAHLLMDRSYYARKHIGDVYFEWRMVQTTQSQYEGQRFGYIVVARNGELLYESTDTTSIALDDVWVDSENYGYAVPRQARLTGRSAEGRELTLVQSASTEVKVKDPLAKVPALERAIAEQFAKPMSYEMVGTWNITLTGVEPPINVSDEGSTYSITVLR